MLKTQGKVQVQQDKASRDQSAAPLSAELTAARQYTPLTSHHGSWASRGKLRPKFGLDSTSLVWTRGPLRNSFHSTPCSHPELMQPQKVHAPTGDLGLKSQALIHQ